MHSSRLLQTTGTNAPSSHRFSVQGIRPGYCQQPGRMGHSSRLLAITGTDAPPHILKRLAFLLFPNLAKDLDGAAENSTTDAGRLPNFPAPIRRRRSASTTSRLARASPVANCLARPLPRAPPRGQLPRARAPARGRASSIGRLAASLPPRRLPASPPRR